MPNAIDKLKSNLKQPSFSENFERNKRAEARSKSKDMGDTESLSVASLLISTGVTGPGTNTSALGVRQKYVLKNKATDTDQQEADSVPFVDWMIELYQNPKDRNEWEKAFNTTCSPFLKEMEITIQNAISIIAGTGST